jgi:hypothetical protein
MRTTAKIEKLACAMWAREKCTTPFGIDIDHWEQMHRVPKARWILAAKKHYATRTPQADSPS